MASDLKEKLPKLILKLDLGCCGYSEMLKYLLRRLQEFEKIKTIVYDVRMNTITISGPFDAEQLKKILLSKSCGLIKDIEIVSSSKGEQKPPDKPQPPKVVVCPFPVQPPCCWQPCSCPSPCEGRGGRRCCTCGKEDSGCAPTPSCSPPCSCTSCGGGGGCGGGGCGGHCGRGPCCYKIICEEAPCNIDPCKLM